MGNVSDQEKVLRSISLCFIDYCVKSCFSDNTINCAWKLMRMKFLYYPCCHLISWVLSSVLLRLYSNLYGLRNSPRKVYAFAQDYVSCNSGWAHRLVGQCLRKHAIIWICDSRPIFLWILEKGGNFLRKRWRVLLICLSHTPNGVEDQFYACQRRRKIMEKNGSCFIGFCGKWCLSGNVIC